MLLHFYLLVNAHTQESHEGVLHEAFDHGATVEPLENHETVQEHNNTGEHQDVYNYDAEMHNDLHELVHDGSNFIMEDHVDDHPAWNFMEDTNKAVEENTSNPYSTQGAHGNPSRTSTAAAMSTPGQGSQRFAAPTSMTGSRFGNQNNFNSSAVNGNSMNNQPPMSPASNRFINPMSPTSNRFTTGNMGSNSSSLNTPRQPMFQPRTQSAAPTAGGLGCTTDPAKATMMANQLIGMLFRSSQMMSEIVNMFNAPNPRSSGTARPNTGTTFNQATGFPGMNNFNRPPMASAANASPTTNPGNYSYTR